MNLSKDQCIIHRLAEFCLRLVCIFGEEGEFSPNNCNFEFSMWVELIWPGYLAIVYNYRLYQQAQCRYSLQVQYIYICTVFVDTPILIPYKSSWKSSLSILNHTWSVDSLIYYIPQLHTSKTSEMIFQHQPSHAAMQMVYSTSQKH